MINYLGHHLRRGENLIPLVLDQSTFDPMNSSSSSCAKVKQNAQQKFTKSRKNDKYKQIKKKILNTYIGSHITKSGLLSMLRHSQEYKSFSTYLKSYLQC